MLGLEIDENIEVAVKRLTERAVRITEPIGRAEAGAWAGDLFERRKISVNIVSSFVNSIRV